MSTTHYDLSRMLDRADALVHEAEDLCVSKIDNAVDPDLRAAASEVAEAATHLKWLCESRLGSPDAYVGPEGGER